MNQKKIQYQSHLYIFFALEIFWFIALFYPMYSLGDKYLSLIGEDNFIILIGLPGVIIYSLLVIIVSSYKIEFDLVGFKIRHIFSQEKFYKYSDIKSIYNLTKNSSVVILKEGSCFPLVGLNRDGKENKQLFELYAGKP